MPKITTLFMILVSIGFLCVSAFASDFDESLMCFRCSIGYFKLTRQIKTIIDNSTRFVGVENGYLYKHDFFSIDSNKLYITSIDTGKVTLLMDLKALPENHYNGLFVGYADDKQIIISAQYFSVNLPINKWPRLISIYRIDRNTKQLKRENISDAANYYFSVYKGDKIYYTAKGGDVVEFGNNKATPLGFKGAAPSISSDGQKIAYIDIGFVNNNVTIYDMKTNKHSIIFTDSPATDYDYKLRFSNDGKFILIRVLSEFSRKPVVMVDITNNRTVAELYDAVCNWFFDEVNDGLYK